MAVASLRYRPDASPVEESKAGYVVFCGEAHEYHYWHFRTRLKIELIPALPDGDDNFYGTRADEVDKVAEKHREVMRQIVENLRGDALNLAMEIGINELYGADGPRLLQEAMLSYIFPVARHESKQLHKEGHKVREGVFVRQTGESMQSYILRRKRWWTLLKQLDSSVRLSTEHLGDMLLDAAGIQDWQRQMILTSTGNSTEFAAVEKALMEQMGASHKKEPKQTTGHARGYSRYSSGSGKGGKPYVRQAFIAGLDDMEYEDNERDCGQFLGNCGQLLGNCG